MPTGFVGWATCELLFEIFGTKNRHFDEEKFTCDSTCIGVVEDGPDGDLKGVRVRVMRVEGGQCAYEILKLPSCLFDDAVLAVKDDAHATEIADLRAADDEGVDVEPSTSQNPRHTRQNPRFVLDQTIENVSVIFVKSGT